MDTIIEQQVAIDEALVPHAQSHGDPLQPSSISALPGRALAMTASDYLKLKFCRDYTTRGILIMHICCGKTLYIRNSNAYKEYYAVATEKAAPKPKASVRRNRSSSDTSITPPTVTADERIGSIPGVSDVPIDESEEELSWNSTNDEGADDEGKDGDDDEEDEGDDGEEGDGDDDDEDDDGEEGDDDDAEQEVKRDADKDDEEEGGDDEHEFEEEESDEETRDEESFDPIPKTPKNSKDDGNDDEDLGLNIGGEEGHSDEEEEDELYRDVNISQGRRIQATLEVEDTHVTLTLVNPDGCERGTQTEVLTRSSHSSRTSYAVAADLSEMELKKIIIEKIEGNKSIQRSNEQRNLYKALVEAYESDKIILDTYGETITLKRRRDDDANKDEEPFARPDRGSKRPREGKEPDSASALTETATRSAGRSTQGSRSRQASASESAIAEEPMQTTFHMDEPSHPEFDTDHDWKKTLPAIHRSIQPWISELVKRTDSRSSFNKLMDTPLDFFNFLMNQLRVDTLTPKLLAGPTYELIKGSCKSLVELEYHLEEVYKATTDQLDWVNPEGQQYPHNLFYGFAVNRESARDVYSKRRIIAVTELKIVEWHSYKYLDWITLNNLTIEERFAFNVSLRMFTRSIVIQRRVEDLQLGVKIYQKKLNLTKPDMYRSDMKHKEAYTAYSNPRGFIYQNKDKKNMLMRIDELHKFSDGTLTDVRTSLDDRLKGIRMRYLPQTIWMKSDKDRAAAMIQAIDKRLKTRRIMGSLERFIGGRLYEEDFRMLQRTI
uniref:Uncharacterized protein n=1 Tax=Tanacetum cinerariifolium TaxID=118510 RepID=A0A699I4R1_TANCI|nr:hypothetical protein [Tanacetum cinerariifolium]